jgi:hypothetical protein
MAEPDKDKPDAGAEPAVEPDKPKADPEVDELDTGTPPGQTVGPLGGRDPSGI